MLWLPNGPSSQESQQHHRFRESIPSMHYTPINANSQRSVFEHMNHGPVPVRGAQPQGQQAIESRQYLQSSAPYQRFQTAQTIPGQQQPRPLVSQFDQPPTNIGHFQHHLLPATVRVQDTSLHQSRPTPPSLGIVPQSFRQQPTIQQQPLNFQHQQQFSPVPAAPFLPQPNTRPHSTNRPSLTTPQFDTPIISTTTDSFDGSNDEQQQPTQDWNQQRLQQQTFRQTTRRYKEHV